MSATDRIGAESGTGARSGAWRAATAIVIGLLVGTGVLFVASSMSPANDGTVPPAQIRGTLAYYTLTSRGDVDGFLLGDGTEIRVPRHLATSLVIVARPGDAVTVQGRPEGKGPVIEADEVHNDATGATLARKGPRPRRDHGLTHIAGRVRFTLHGPDGKPDGAVLDDGTVLRMPADDPERFAAKLTSGQTVPAQGWLLSTPFGRVVDVNWLE